jgi:hypothetical protein
VASAALCAVARPANKAMIATTTRQEKRTKRNLKKDFIAE